MAKPSALTAGARLFDLGTGSASSDNIFLRISNSGNLAELGVYSGATGTFAQSAAALEQDKYQLLEVIDQHGSPNDTATVYVDGVAGSTNSSMVNVPSVSRTANYIGQDSSGANKFDGSIAEVILFPSALTDSDRTAVEAYLTQKFQLMTQAPSQPIISVSGGTLNGPTQVAISSQPGTIIRITNDGTTPDSSSPVYDGCPITINYSQTLKAVAFRKGLKSGTASASYVLDSTQWPAPGSSTTAPPINLTLPIQSN